MENQEYLNQIAESSKPVTSTSGKSGFSLSGILHSKFFLIGAIGIVALIFIAILGSALSGNKKDIKTDIVALNYHIDNTSSLINTYQPNVKSSDLRSYSASLQSVLSNTSSDLSNYLTTKYNHKESKEDKNLATELATEKDALENELFEAKINGNLDRIYAHKMTYEISKFMSEELSIYNSTKDEALQAILNQSYSSLENLYDNFNDFSETK
ncbi:hypothetical protein IKE82_00775 [Candidatus Saccharibacteria bacterium]|nr:hypothetical protein [Candidatus Saccharibacteria bacterium]